MLNKSELTNRESRIPGFAPRSGADANRNGRLTVLGLDPGLANFGYGIIKKENNELSFIKAGLIKTVPLTIEPDRLNKLQQELKKIIKKFKPDLMAVEELFFCKNVKTALTIGQVIGIIFLTASQVKIPIKEFTPLQIKQALTSYGRADKKQLALMVKIILKLPTAVFSSHAADALACAICCAQTKPWIKN